MADSTAAAPLPSGENNADQLIKSLSVVAGISFVMMNLRFFCKLRYAKGFGVDDAVLALGFACLIASVALECTSTRYGLGQHIYEVNLTKLPKANELLFVGEFFGIIGIAFAKTSFCLTLLRLAIKRWHKALIWTCIVTVNLFMWPCGITFFVGCTPLAKKWDSTVPGTCVDAMPIVYFAVFAGSWSAMTDFILAIFPWFLVWNLQMRRIEKIGVCICMSMGVLSGIFAIVKSAYLIPSFEDYTYKSTPLLIWSGSELAIVIMASSIPFLRLFWKEIHAKTTSRSNGKGGYHSGYKMDHMNTYAKMGSNQVSATRTQVRAETTHKVHDDDSDKSILAQSVNLHQIMRTDEVTVEHQRTYEVV